MARNIENGNFEGAGTVEEHGRKFRTCRVLSPSPIHLAPASGPACAAFRRLSIAARQALDGGK